MSERNDKGKLTAEQLLKKYSDDPILDWNDVRTLGAVKAMRHALRHSEKPKPVDDLTGEDRIREESFFKGAEWAWGELTARLRYIKEGKDLKDDNS